MKALWEALNDTSIGPDTIMAMILDPKCGIERRSVVEDGKILNNTGSDANQNGGCTPLIMAAIADRDDVLEALLVAGADATSADSRSGRMPLHQAVANGNAHALQLLLEHFCKSGIRWCRRDAVPAANSYYHYVNAADIFDFTPLLLASSFCFYTGVEILLQYGADPGVRLFLVGKQRTAAHVSASNCDTASLELLLAAGADVNLLDDNSHTYLHLASVRGSRGSINLLMEEGSSVDSIDCDSKTPLHFAVAGFHFCSALLLSYGANINAVTNNGSSPLRLSVTSGNANCVLLLCSEGADVNVMDAQGHTAIQGAASEDALVMDLLLDNGADMSAMDKAFITRATSCAECIDVLQSEGFHGLDW